MFLVGISSLIVAMGVTWMTTPAVIRLAEVIGAVDLPGARKAHSEPIPRIGGLAVFLGFLAGLTFAAFATGNALSVPVGVYWRGLAMAATFLLLVGLADDIWGLSFRWKFAAQILAASFVWWCGFRIELITHPLGGGIELGWMSFPITLLWIIGITNAVNLIDGLDGLASGIALITTATVAVIAAVRQELGVTAASVALAGSLIGFLRYNFNPARIFLGDSGSLFLGFVLAVTSVRGSQKGPTAVAVMVPLLVLGLPLLDTGLAVLRRLHRLGSHGRRSEQGSLGYVLRNFDHVFLPDKGHIHHRLLELGLTQRGAVLTLWVVGVLFALAAFALVVLKSPLLALVLGGALLLLLATYIALLYLRIGRTGPTPRRPADGPKYPVSAGETIAASSEGRLPS
jgi:UDP-GlcNAc:undecaprenyl-phosphate GlcNAc-1-phosphate transferase